MNRLVRVYPRGKGILTSLVHRVTVAIAGGSIRQDGDIARQVLFQVGNRLRCGGVGSRGIAGQTITSCADLHVLREAIRPKRPRPCACRELVRLRRLRVLRMGEVARDRRGARYCKLRNAGRVGRQCPDYSRVGLDLQARRGS